MVQNTKKKHRLEDHRLLRLNKKSDSLIISNYYNCCISFIYRIIGIKMEAIAIIYS